MSDIDLLKRVKTRQARKAAPTMAGECATPPTTADEPGGATLAAGAPADTGAPAAPENTASGQDSAPAGGSQADVEADAGAATAKTAGPIPGIEGRPCWRVLEDWTDPGGGAPKLRPGVWHFGLKMGRGDSPPTLTQTHVCGPLQVVAETTNAAGANFGRLLRFRTTRGEWKTWAMPMTMLAGDGTELRAELLYMGLEIDPQARHLLPQYLQHKAPARRLRCVDQTGWAGGGLGAFVLPDAVIGPDAGDVVYQSEAHASEEYTTAGTLAGWQQDIGAQAVGNPLLVLAICTAFAGPVLARCNAESGGLHIVGDSSTGKTTAIEAARSVWGGEGFKRSWRTTSNGLEGAATLFNDCLLALDEISECDPREVGAIVYSLGNGRGKQRASRTGAARSVRAWRCSVLSSGEFTIETTMAAGGQRIKAGQAVRLMDVSGKRRHGSWDTLHSHASGPAMSESIKRAAARHYGHAGRAFLEHLAYDESDMAAAWDAMKTLPELTPDAQADGQVKRVAARFALLALAGELAAEYGITPWPAGEAINAAAVGFRSWLLLRGDPKVTHESAQVLERLAEFLEKHGDSRFTDKDHPPPPERAALVRDRAGWYELTTSGARRYLFTTSGLKEALRGFDIERAKGVLVAAGVLPKAGADGKRSELVRIEGQRLRVYVVDPVALYPDGGETVGPA